jgi:riboflavin synthase
VFTGLIEETGKIVSVKNSGDGKILEIKGKKVLEGTVTGDSISINGACQTVTDITADTFSVFVSKVTLGITTLGDFKPGSVVNLERALTLTTRLGGHIVQGHVDFKGMVRHIVKDSRGVEVEIEASGSYLKYIVEKGSIAVDGISLTVVSALDSAFKLYLIPETLENTNIPLWKTGTYVNIETDILAKYIERIILFGKGGHDEENKNETSFLSKLAEGGFI